MRAYTTNTNCRLYYIQIRLKATRYGSQNHVDVQIRRTYTGWKGKFVTDEFYTVDSMEICMCKASAVKLALISNFKVKNLFALYSTHHEGTVKYYLNVS